MGGTIAVTIRQHDKSLVKMARWTNIFPYVVMEKDFIEDQDTYFKKFIGEWEKLRRDYLKHEKDKKFKYPMTECYASDSEILCAPIGYGLIFIDRFSKEIHHMQGYTSLDKITLSAYYNEKHGSVLGMKFPEESAFPWLADNKRLSYSQFVDKKGFSTPKPIDSLKHLDQLDETRGPNDYINLHFDLSPWKVLSYEETGEGSKEFRAALTNLGVKFTKEEIKVWEEHFK